MGTVSFKYTRALGLCALLGVMQAQASGVPAKTEAAIKVLRNQSAVKAALEQIQRDDERTLAEQIELAEIASPPFKEQTRANDYVRRLRELGLIDVTIDAEGNVIARRPGARKVAPMLVLSAHLDTVFEEGTNVKVRRDGKRYYGAGIGDDARGLSVLLTVLRAMQENKLRTQGDVLFVGTVGEEALGNLGGVKALFRDRSDIDGFISVDKIDHAPGDTDVVARAVGSHRWQITFTGPGGHSYQNFGTPSAVHALGRAV